MNRDFWTCGSVSEVGGSLARKLRFGILMLSLKALLRQNALTGTALCEPRSADFVARAAICEGGTGGTALFAPRRSRSG